MPVFGISISEQPKIYFNHRNTLISLLSNTLYSDIRPHWYNGGLTPNESERLFREQSGRVANFS
ncbi:hypothetical protein [Candidatus Arsenophonus triatominarum]|uniref:hypothetical protein n=1 Tax=Candidatus Arsenophonus triatominarum TaxID=57911 RepID=UPI0013967952|nr:hypothetical protein [Candidatus Arsenophonus triatominarum]